MKELISVQKTEKYFQHPRLQADATADLSRQQENNRLTSLISFYAEMIAPLLPAEAGQTVRQRANISHKP